MQAKANQSDEQNYSSESSQYSQEESTLCSDKIYNPKIQPITYHILSRIEKKKFIDFFKGQAQFNFSNHSLMMTYKDDDVRSKVVDWINKITRKQHKLQGNTKSKILASDCISIRNQLNKRGFNLFQKDGKCYLAAHSKSEEDFNQAKSIINSSYYQLVRDNILSDQKITRTQQFIFIKIFNTAIQKVTFSNPNILSIDPKFFGKFQKTLQYVIRSTSRINNNIIPTQIKQAYKKYKSLLLVTTKPQNRHTDCSVKNITFYWHYDKKIKRQYLCIVFKRNLNADDICQDVKTVLQFYKCRLEGVRFFQNFTKLKLQNIYKKASNQKNIVSYFPEKNPYSVDIKKKVISDDITEDIKEYISIAKSKSSKLQGEEQIKKQETILGSKVLNSSLMTSQNESVSEQLNYTNSETRFVFLKGKQQPFKMESQSECLYSQYPINVVCKQFQQKWEQNPEQTKTFVLKGYAWQGMTLQKLESSMGLSNIKLQVLQKFIGKVQQFTIGQVKLKLFESNKRAWGIKPTYHIKKIEK